MCHTSCSSSGYQLFGVEYSQYCFCANAFSYAPSNIEPCVSTCAGDKNQTGGGYDAISVYDIDIPSNVDPSGGTYLGCDVDSTSRVLAAYFNGILFILSSFIKGHYSCSVDR